MRYRPDNTDNSSKYIADLREDFYFEESPEKKDKQKDSSSEEFFLFLYKFLFIVILGLFSARILTVIYNSQIFKQASSVILAIFEKGIN